MKNQSIFLLAFTTGAALYGASATAAYSVAFDSFDSSGSPGWHSGAPRDGFVLGIDTLELSLEKNLQRIQAAAALGAGHFNIPVPLCQETGASETMRWCFEKNPAQTPYPIRLRSLIAAITERGWSVGLFPFPMADDGTWRGHFKPVQFEAWAAQYRDHLQELVRWTRDLPIADFIVGSELSLLYPRDPAFWRGLLETIRQDLKCKSFVVANWDAIAEVSFWEASDYIGTSSYFPLVPSESADSSVAALVRGWQKWKSQLLDLSQKKQRKLYFAELGYASRSDAARRPWAYAPPARLDLDLQSRLFLAFSQVWVHDPRLARFTVWALVDLPTPLTDSGFVVIGKPAARVLEYVFASRASRKPRATDVNPPDRPVVLTIDDLPVWFVPETKERLKIFDQLKTALAKHAVPAIAFVNPGFLNDSSDDHRERDALRGWMDAGFTLANHTATHKPVSHPDFLLDLALGEQLMHKLFPGWDAQYRFFRFPNLEAGELDKLRERGYTVLGTNFDSRDWSWSEKYHYADPTTRAAIAQTQIQDISQRFATQTHTEQPVIMMLHSTEFQAQNLDTILAQLEQHGARWADARTAQFLETR